MINQTMVILAILAFDKSVCDSKRWHFENEEGRKAFAKKHRIGLAMVFLAYFLGLAVHIGFTPLCRIPEYRAFRQYQIEHPGVIVKTVDQVLPHRPRSGFW